MSFPAPPKTSLALPLLLFLLALSCPPSGDETPAEAQRRHLDSQLRLNQIQILGSHNSYKQAISPSLLAIIAAEDSALATTLDYGHMPVGEQLALGMRSLELDVYHDPQGGRYAQPFGPQAVAAQGLPPGPPTDSAGVMHAPGYKVLHIQDIDFRTSCLTLQACLAEIRRWSDAHRAHLPLIITINAKDEIIERPQFARPLPFDSTAFAQLDAEFRQAFADDRLIRPDDVRGDFPTLEQAVLAQRWPTLGAARGKVMFVLDDDERKTAAYIAGHPSLAGRVMFVNAREGTAEAAVRIVNDPIADFDYIQSLVKSGYLVRTRADADTREARRNDRRRFEDALASGAQLISTDYYLPNPAFDNDYQVRFPEGIIARCNPLLAGEGCADALLEQPPDGGLPQR